MTALDDLATSGMLRTEVPLAGSTTYKVGGTAHYYLEAQDEAQLLAIGEAIEDEPLLVLGRGSNLIVSDAGFPGVVIRLGREFGHTEFNKDGTVTSGAATSMPSLARSCARAGRAGLEFLVGIPGSVGGGVRMNAGCHGSEIKERLRLARVVELKLGDISDRQPADLDMTYRRTNLRPDEIVTSATFTTDARDRETVEKVMRDIVRWRRDHQPGGTLNAGSIFKNPPGDSAGRIVDNLGLKGTRIGGASVSTKHANFFVAEEGVKAQDVYDLVWAIRRRVGIETGVWLEPEVQFVGPFRPSPDEDVR